MDPTLRSPRLISPEGTHQLCETLTQLVEREAVMGPCKPKIRALGLSMESLVDTLRTELPYVDAEDGPLLLADIEQFDKLASFLRAYCHQATLDQH